MGRGPSARPETSLEATFPWRGTSLAVTMMILALLAATGCGAGDSPESAAPEPASEAPGEAPESPSEADVAAAQTPMESGESTGPEADAAAVPERPPSTSDAREPAVETGPAAAPGEIFEAAAADPRPAVKKTDSFEAWDRVLQRHQRAGGLDYEALAADRGDLDAFLAVLSSTSPEALTARSRERQLAFWINAYNAVVAHFVLERYPEIESVLKVEGFFKAQTFPVAGEELTLDEIEKRALILGEPRVHFAVVCASVGCPDLRGDAFRAPELERQLAEQTAAFLADPSKGLRWEGPGEKLWLSSLFDWYTEDFGGDPVAWILPRLEPEQAKALATLAAGERPEIAFLDYDWSLNDRPRG